MKTKLLKIGNFDIVHVLTEPERIESRIVFGRNDISQKLIFSLMDMTYNYGFGCSAPFFDNEFMFFLIGGVLPNKKSLKKHTLMLCECLENVKLFVDSFNKQLDFTNIDISMFTEIDIDDFYPEQIAAVRDQQYDGSWNKFKKDLLKNGKDLEIDVIKKCIKFEKINKKDIGLVGHKLNYIIHLMETDIGDRTNSN